MAVGNTLRIPVKLETKDFSKEIEEVETKLNDLKSTLELAQGDSFFKKTDIQEMETEVEKLNNKLVGLYKKQLQIDKVDYSNITKGLNTVGQKTKSIIKQMIHWGLAIFGIRSAYNLLRSSMSTIMQYDEQLAADVEYMKNAIAFALEPIIRVIVDLMKQLMLYVGYIIKAWTGYNIFENANKSLQKSNKEAKKLSKTLASFDEMNVLQDNTSSSGNSDVAPSFDLTNPENIKPPEWLTWIADNKDLILATLGGIAGAIIAIKLGLSGIKALGIGLIVAGVITLIQNLLKYYDKLDSTLKDNGTTWEDFGGILQGISLILIGIGLLTGQVEIAIAGLILLIVSTIMTNWNNIKQWWDTQVAPKITEKLNWMRDNLGILGENIYAEVTRFKDLIVNRVEGIFRPIKNVLDGILLFIKGDFFGGLKNILKGILNFVVGRINTLIDALNMFLVPLQTTMVAIGRVTGQKVSIDSFKIPHVPYLAKGGIINMPNRGVMVGGAIAGESGREGVLPLTDSQAMEQLGEAIGRYITINANITNTMNGRIISRELQKINNENNFAFNR